MVLAAARVSGIAANIAHPVSFLTENVAIQTNVMMSAVEVGVKSIMSLGSFCIYPRLAPQPIQEYSFMTGLLEPTNESYEVAKIIGIRLAQAKHQEHGIRIAMANQQTKTHRTRTTTTNTQPLPRLKTQIALETY